jgi:hypothetical protein
MVAAVALLRAINSIVPSTRRTGGIDRLSRSLFDAAVDINPHQVKAALFALHSPVSQGVTEARERMQSEQKALYYITGGSESMLRNSPLLEIYKKKGIEVLILDDDIDEIVFSSITKYGGIDLKAVNKSSTSEDLKDDSTAEKTEELKPLLEKIKATLGEAVKEVRALSRLADLPLKDRTPVSVPFSCSSSFFENCKRIAPLRGNRDLCRDSLARTDLTTTYKTREERPDIRKSPWSSIPVGFLLSLSSVGGLDLQSYLCGTRGQVKGCPISRLLARVANFVLNWGIRGGSSLFGLAG